MKKSKIVVAALTAAAIAVSCGAFAGCKDGDKNNGGDNPPAGSTYEITFNANGGHWADNKTTVTLTTDANGYLAAKPNPDPTRDDYTFASYNLAQNGSGTTVTYGTTGYKFTANTTVYAQWTEAAPAPSTPTVTISCETLTLAIDKTEDTLTAQIANGEANAEIVWSSDNESVVLVGEETGAVEALKPGSATITATIKGTQITDTCDILVEDAYYIIGAEDPLWNKCATFGDANFTYFMPTETEGVYKTASTELTAKSNFQVALVGRTDGNWWQAAYGKDNISTEADNALSLVNGNIGVQKHGKYTLTLDLRDKQNVTVYGVMDEEIEDGDVEYVYYLIGGMNGWTTADTVEAAGDYVFTSNNDGTYSLTTKLTKGWEFKIVVVGMQYKVEFGESALLRTLIGVSGTATADTDYQLEWTSSANIGVGVEGWYTFTFTPEADSNQQLSYTFSATDPSVTTPEA